MVAELEDEVELPLPSENLDQVHQVRVLQVLQHSDDDDDHDQLPPKERCTECADQNTGNDMRRWEKIEKDMRIYEKL